jgi:hypothetical protein
MLEWSFDALCTKCNFGIEQVEYINMIFSSNRQEAYMMPKCRKTRETREINATLEIFYKKVENNKDFVALYGANRKPL